MTTETSPVLSRDDFLRNLRNTRMVGDDEFDRVSAHDAALREQLDIEKRLVVVQTKMVDLIHEYIADVLETTRQLEQSQAEVTRLREALQNMHAEVDESNEQLGTKEELCIWCHAGAYNADGIIHDAQCILRQARRALAGPKEAVDSHA